jgi:hypothetical protein
MLNEGPQNAAFAVDISTVNFDLILKYKVVIIDLHAISTEY